MADRCGGPAPLCIAGGLGLLFAHLTWPALPAVSGLAFIALGSTLAVAARCDDVHRRRPLVAAHLVVYANLYLIFLGAIFHAAMTGTPHGLSWWQTADLLLSVAPMATAARLAIGIVASSEDASTR
jgi:hypothetical protein